MEIVPVYTYNSNVNRKILSMSKFIRFLDGVIYFLFEEIPIEIGCN